MDFFGLGRNDEPNQESAPEGEPLPAPEPPRGPAGLWAALLVLDAAFVIVFGGAVAANVYKHWGAAPAAPAAPEAGRRRAAKKPAPKAEEAPKTATPDAPAEAKALPAAAAPTPGAGPIVTVRSAAKARKVVFSLDAPGAKSVKLVGAFLMRGGRLNLAKRGGAWTGAVYLNPGRYRYFFSVDGRKVLDPGAAGSDRGASVLDIP